MSKNACHSKLLVVGLAFDTYIAAVGLAGSPWLQLVEFVMMLAGLAFGRCGWLFIVILAGSLLAEAVLTCFAGCGRELHVLHGDVLDLEAPIACVRSLPGGASGFGAQPTKSGPGPFGSLDGDLLVGSLTCAIKWFLRL
jgi:hypothetical protein